MTRSFRRALTLTGAGVGALGAGIAVGAVTDSSWTALVSGGVAIVAGLAAASPSIGLVPDDVTPRRADLVESSDEVDSPVEAVEQEVPRPRSRRELLVEIEELRRRRVAEFAEEDRQRRLAEIEEEERRRRMQISEEQRQPPPDPSGGVPSA
jgi:hypothetical protein